MARKLACSLKRAPKGRFFWKVCPVCVKAFYTRWINADLCAACAATAHKAQRGSGGEPRLPTAS